MAAIPQLNAEDLHQFTTALNDLLARSEASTALLVEESGFLIHQSGDCSSFDTTLVATLASNAYNATKYMAGIVNEPSFSGMYQQGERFSTLILKVDESFLLVIVFKASLSVGAVKYFGVQTAAQIARQLKIAGERSPEKLDLLDMNATDAASLFRRK